MTRRLAELTSPLVRAGALVLVPVGSVEQHGPHLPLDTDAVIAVAVADGLAAELDAVVAPAVAYGSSGEHQSFAGTSSIGTDALVHTLVELTRSLSTWAGRIVFVNGHGGNVDALRVAVKLLTEQGHRVSWVPCGTGAEVAGDLHAGRLETSLMLYLRPDAVHLDRAVPGVTRPLAELLPALREGGVAAVSPNGVLGDPTGASPTLGAALLAEMVERASASLGELVR